MSRKVKILHLATILSIVLYYGTAFAMCDFSFDESKCVDLGIVIAPLFIPILILVPWTLITDLVVLARKFAPESHKNSVGKLIAVTLACAIILAMATMAVITYRQDHYSVEKTVKIIQNCQAEGLRYDGSSIYLSTSDSNAKVPASGRAQIAQAVRDSASKCEYDLELFSLDY